MVLKEQEYTYFEPERAREIFFLLKPHLHLKSFNIHIIGTNGKGSTGRFLAQSLFESGYKILHFTSPHLLDFSERFYIDDHVVDCDKLQKAHLFLQQFDFINRASYFEYATFLAFVLGEDSDFLIMEAGVGGEHDSTSVLDYDVTIFTRIGIDHKDLLGNDLQSIAITKLRAAQGRIFVHFQDNDVLNIFSNLGSVVASGYYANNKLGDISYLRPSDMQHELVRLSSNKNDLPMFLQENLALVSLVVEYININVKKVNLTNSPLKLRARCEIFNPQIMLDVGHNEMAAQAALNEMLRFSNGEKFILIYNSYKGKEVSKILEIFQHYVEKIVIFAVEHQRILPQESIIKDIDRLGIGYEVFSIYEQNLLHFSKCLVESMTSFFNSDKKYLVFGSFSLVESFLLWYQNREGYKVNGSKK
ncbi:FolC protein [Helicobacter muridarum]|nr:FolC protein [Helicobacter muridarum]